MKVTILSLVTLITVVQFSLPIEAAPTLKSNGLDTMKASDILHLVQRKTRAQRVASCIRRAEVDYAALNEICRNSLPDKKGSRQDCYQIAADQFAGEVANCNRM